MAVGIPVPTLFAAAAVVLLGGHVVRAARHSFFFSRGDVPERFDLLLGLTLGQALNSLLPLRIGELVRSLFIAIRLRLRVSYVLATVAAERLADVIAVAVISAALAEGAVGRRHLLLQTALWLALVAWVGVTVAMLVQYVPWARRLVWQVASVFNDELRLAIVDFFSTLAHLVTDGPYLTVRFLVATLCMWGLYLGAYALYAESVGSTLTDVSYALLGAPLRPLLDEALHGAVSRASLSLFVFTAIPVGVVLIYGIARQHREISRSIRFVGRFGLTPVQVSRPPVRSRFRNATDYAAFLQAHFSATDELVSTFVTEGTEDVVVHRLLPGGSD
ncbi:MAG: flippase-like domain-containing protein, partial [Candidatus Eremiobacteraeota bacterium]|nr:flippase-like domain-containing protein [Candidatus Eremiobacteraeota bacterium]